MGENKGQGKKINKGSRRDFWGIFIIFILFSWIRLYKTDSNTVKGDPILKKRIKKKRTINSSKKKRGDSPFVIFYFYFSLRFSTVFFDSFYFLYKKEERRGVTFVFHREILVCFAKIGVWQGFQD
ncbi:hypothetical protein ES332_D05G215900v1 [Gossypium tomentosum]|uniref:Uncharacterized protein n=1 Tax=Gossypium tomentosum TaxID=34277 RepID=A0A5D2KYR2_GOSTO|nr:hypothetical protein ES332_D05G215900v1 [Gossypium tomentosum]